MTGPKNVQQQQHRTIDDHYNGIPRCSLCARVSIGVGADGARAAQPLMRRIHARASQAARVNPRGGPMAEAT